MSGEDNSHMATVSDDGEKREMLSSNDDNAAPSTSQAAASASLIEAEKESGRMAISMFEKMSMGAPVKYREQVSDNSSLATAEIWNSLTEEQKEAIRKAATRAKQEKVSDDGSLAAAEIWNSLTEEQKEAIRKEAARVKQEKKEEEEESNEEKSVIEKIIYDLRFMQKVKKEVPVAKEYLELAVEKYNYVKNSNCISKCMLGSAETTAYTVLRFMRIPLLPVDCALVWTFNLVKKFLPFITHEREKIVDETVSAVEYVTRGRCALDCACKIVEKSFGLVLCENIKVSNSEQQKSLCKR